MVKHIWYIYLYRHASSYQWFPHFYTFVEISFVYMSLEDLGGMESSVLQPWDGSLKMWKLQVKHSSEKRAARGLKHSDWNIRLWFMNRRRWPSRHWPSPRFSKSRRSGRRCPGTHQGKTWKVRKVKSQQDRVTIKLVQMNLSGWWYTYPSKKYEFVSWDDYSQYMEIIKKSSKVPNSCVSLLWLYKLYLAEVIRLTKVISMWYHQAGDDSQNHPS